MIFNQLQQPLWNSLLTHYKDLKVLVEGPLTGLKQCFIALNKPRSMMNKVELKQI